MTRTLHSSYLAHKTLAQDAWMPSEPECADATQIMCAEVSDYANAFG